jgi:hypothetical protein
MHHHLMQREALEDEDRSVVVHGLPRRSAAHRATISLLSEQMSESCPAGVLYMSFRALQTRVKLEVAVH